MNPTTALRAGHPAATVPALALVLNAFVWGVSCWPFRRLESAGLHPLCATALIYAVAVIAISLARPAAWRELVGHPALWLLVLASGTTNAAFNWAVTIGDVVRVVLLFYLMPLWAVLLERLLLDERLTRSALLRVVLAHAVLDTEFGIDHIGDHFHFIHARRTALAGLCHGEVGADGVDDYVIA